MIRARERHGPAIVDEGVPCQESVSRSALSSYHSAPNGGIPVEGTGTGNPINPHLTRNRIHGIGLKPVAGGLRICPDSVADFARLAWISQIGAP